MTTNSEKPVLPVEPFEAWWPKYLARVTESVTAAEEYLEIPKGTISSIQWEADFIATVKTYAVIEPLLNDLLAKHPPRNTSPFGLSGLLESNPNYRDFVIALNIGGRTGKLRLAEGLKLLARNHVSFIESVVLVRNRYAHNVKNMHRSLTDILTEEQTNNAKIVANLTGLKITLPDPMIENAFLKGLMYHRLADYLAHALDTLKPPPLPQGGLFGLFGSTAAANAVYDEARDRDSDSCPATSGIDP